MEDIYLSNFLFLISYF